VEDGATPHLLPESLRESKKTLAPESPSGKFPGQAGAPKSRHQGGKLSLSVSANPSHFVITQ
jgi:hypothetical protein